jgi:hypothetical protein
MQVSEIDMALVGEDQRSIEKNVSAIVAECKKPHPDRRLLDEKMRRTAPYRQKICRVVNC